MNTDGPTPTDDGIEEEPPLGSPWQDLRAYVGSRRLDGLILSPDGSALLVAVSSLDAEKTAYRTALWKVDLAGRAPARRITRSVEGEASAAFLPGGDLLFSSRRALPATGEKSEPDVKSAGAIWCLPAEGGEAYVVARRDGGWQQIITARRSARTILATPMHMGVADEKADAKKRADRAKRKINAILHESYPVRFWDHDLGPESVRLTVADLDAARGDDHDLTLTQEQSRDLTGDVGRALGEGFALCDDGSRLVVGWRKQRERGGFVSALVSIDVTTGERTTIAEHAVDEFGSPVISPNGSLVVGVRENAPTPDTAPDQKLWLVEGDQAGRVLAGDWDAWPRPIAISPDNTTLFVSVDEDGQAPLYAVEIETGARRRLTPPAGAGFGAFGSGQLSPDGSTLYAIRTSYADPGTVVAIATDGSKITELRSVDYPDLPGTLTGVETRTDDGTRVRGWLILPEGAAADSPAPLALWIHGGPLGSWNAWSWRWCPWLMVSQGYAVLLPDPALSTGYGLDFVQRGWGRWGAEPYTDIMALTEAVFDRDDIKPDNAIAMGGSFGGYMANWVAGHTDRFAGIVTHASLWNLESFGPTTDAAWYWAMEMTPSMRAENSPHLFADNIHTPMLVIHGDKDYRVPISEGIALWWELCSRHDGPPETLPHKFLYFPDENHWVLTPQHARVWYETVLAFCASVRTTGNFVRPESL